jgi:magnesium chelatase subunit H
MRFIFLTIDGNHAAVLRAAAERLRREHGLPLSIGSYDAASLRNDADWQRLAADLASADLVFGARLFGEEMVRPLQRLLASAACPVCIITSNPALIRCTHLGRFDLRKSDGEQEPGILQQWVRKLRPQGGSGEARRQLAVLRNLAKVLKLIPGKARDIYTYVVAIQYWTNCSPENMFRLLCLLAERYVPGQQGKLPVLDPLNYPEVALVHPAAEQPFASLQEYERWRKRASVSRWGGEGVKPSQSQKRVTRDSSTHPLAPAGVVGILTLRTVALTGNTAHLAALVEALERRGIEARLAYASGLDQRPALEQFFLATDDRRPTTDDQPTAVGFLKAVIGKDKRKAVVSRQSSVVDLLINATGFALVGGPAESRPADARVALTELDVGYLNLMPLTFQRVEDWQRDDTGLAPIQSALSVAVPELDGASDPLVFGGPTAAGDAFVALPAEIELAAERIAKRVALRRKPNAEKKIAVVIFNFPPNLGNIGTAAYLNVFASLHALLVALRADGYTVEVPADAEALRSTIIEGNSPLHGTDGNVAARLSVADYRKLFPAYERIEPHWGRAPGELLNDGKNFTILGHQFGNIFVGIQPSFGYERDPMRLLMAKDAAPNHAFAAFYTWLREVYGADATVHFGTHGALEFMPGKQVGLSAECWPHKLLGGLPNFYYYSVNNPSEAAIAKRRGAATMVSYLVPPLQQAGLYKGLRALKDSIDAYRANPTEALVDDIVAQAVRLGIGVSDEGRRTKDGFDIERGGEQEALPSSFVFRLSSEERIAALSHELLKIEQRMIPAGLHVLGRPPEPAELVDFLSLAASLHTFERGTQRLTLAALVAEQHGYDYAALQQRAANDLEAQEQLRLVDAAVKRFVSEFIVSQTKNKEQRAETEERAKTAVLSSQFSVLSSQLPALAPFLSHLLTGLTANEEVEGLLHGLRGGFVPPSPSNDVVRDPGVLPTGRNVYSLDPYRVPSALAMERGKRLVGELLERLTEQQGALPETIAVVLWGSDNLKSDCEGVAQVLAMLGAQPVIDELGNVADVALVPLAELGRPRIDVAVTVSGIFRDLLGHQMQLIDRAAHLAALADEPLEFNFVRRHALQQATELNIPLEEAATRVFANAPGSYGANINNLVESSTYDDDGQLNEAFLSRKSFTIGKHGQWREARSLMEKVLGTVDASFQNVDSFEVGISDIDIYYESLGGVTKAVEGLRGVRPPVVVADAVSQTERLSSLEQMVRLETRAKLLNPKWYEAMLAHGYEGAREIEIRLNNTYGWSATTNAVEGWVYQGVAETFVLDEAMRERLSALNANAAAGMVRRLLEANGRGFWDADPTTLESLREIYADLEDRLEGVVS